MVTFLNEVCNWNEAVFFLLEKILEQRNKLNQKLPVLVKIAPDLTDEELKEIAQVLSRKNVSIIYLGLNDSISSLLKARPS